MPKRVQEAGVAWFVTWRLHVSQKMLSDQERSQIQTVLWSYEGKTYGLHAYVVMNDHVHVLVLPWSTTTLSDMVKAWKSLSSRQLIRGFGRKAPIWQKGFFDRGIFSHREHSQKANYILGNPQKRWPDAVDYPWVWALGHPKPDM